jgi:hypothetical protein
MYTSRSEAGAFKVISMPRFRRLAKRPARGEIFVVNNSPRVPRHKVRVVRNNCRPLEGMNELCARGNRQVAFANKLARATPSSLFIRDA